VIRGQLSRWLAGEGLDAGSLTPEAAARFPAGRRAAGMRVGEAIGLDRGDADLDAGVLTVRDGKHGKPRLAPVHDTTARALRDYLRTRDMRRARQQRQPSRQADEHQVENPNCHKPAMLSARRLVPQENQQVSRLLHGFGTPQPLLTVRRHGQPPVISLPKV
jgi:integrase